MKPYKRTERVANLVRSDLAIILQHHGEEIGCKGVCITHVDITPNFLHAKVYITVLDTARLEGTLEALTGNTDYIQRILAKTAKLRSTPRLCFVYDESIRRAEKITAVINEVVAEDNACHDKAKE